jgi:hypothetical protein
MTGVSTRKPSLLRQGSPSAFSSTRPGIQWRPVVGRASAASAALSSMAAIVRSWSGVRSTSQNGPPSMTTNGLLSQVRV